MYVKYKDIEKVVFTTASNTEKYAEKRGDLAELCN